MELGSAVTEANNFWGDEKMTRAELERFIMENYGAEPDYPWIKYPEYKVFRHQGNQKWFALLMTVPKSRLGLESDEYIDIADLKCDPFLLGSMCRLPGFYPGYHMNKNHWITAVLDGTAADEEIKMLLDMSYEATAPRYKKKKRG